MRVKVITGVTGDQDLGLCNLRAVRVGGTANLTGTIIAKVGGVSLDTIPAASTPGTERNYHDISAAGDASAGVKINMSNAGDTAIVFYS